MAQEASQPCIDKALELEVQNEKCKKFSDKDLKKACKEIKKKIKACKREAKKAKKAEEKVVRKSVKKLNLDQKQKLKCSKILQKARGKADKNEVVPERLLKKLEKNKCIGLE